MIKRLLSPNTRPFKAAAAPCPGSGAEEGGDGDVETVNNNTHELIFLEEKRTRTHLSLSTSPNPSYYGTSYSNNNNKGGIGTSWSCEDSVWNPIQGQFSNFTRGISIIYYYLTRQYRWDPTITFFDPPRYNSHLFTKFRFCKTICHCRTFRTIGRMQFRKQQQCNADPEQWEISAFFVVMIHCQAH